VEISNLNPDNTPVKSKGVDGVQLVAAGINGDAYVCGLIAKNTAPGANDVLSSSTGFKSFEALLSGAVTPGTGDNFTEMVAVAWSAAEADSAGVAAILASAVTEFDAAPTSPPVVIPNCRILRTIDDIVGAMWDGKNRIKTIGVRAIGVTPGQVNVVLNLIG